MQKKSPRYQNGSIRKRAKSSGYSWQFVYRDADGKQRVQTFDGQSYPTEKDVLKATERLRHDLNVGVSPHLQKRITVPVAIDTYIDSIRDHLKARTVGTYISHGRIISAAYRDIYVDDLDGLQVQTWLNGLKRAGSQRANIRNLLRGAVRYAMLSKKTNLLINPLDLIRLRDVTTRTKKIIVITPGQFLRLIASTRPPYDRIVLVCGFLGLRIGETLALRWDDFDTDTGTVEIQRSISNGHLSTAKTEASNAVLPVPDTLMAHISDWKRESDKQASESNRKPSEWLFPAPRSARGIHGHSSILMQKVLHPACDKAGIPRIGWHALRHSYRTWMDAAKITTGTAKDMMRHADVSTTMNVYGRTLPAEMREAANSIAQLLG